MANDNLLKDELLFTQTEQTENDNEYVTLQEQAKKELAPISKIPSSPVIKLLVNVLANGGKNLTAIRKYNDSGHYVTTIKVNKDKQMEVIQIESINQKNKSCQRIDIYNYTNLYDHKGTTQKILIFLLKKMITLPFMYPNYKLDLKSVNVHDFTINFTLDELVKLNIYKNKETARKHLFNHLQQLSMVQIRGFNEIKSKRIEQEKAAALFRDIDKIIIGNKNNVAIEVNYKLNFKWLCNYAAALPDIYFYLESKPASLLLNIVFNARANILNYADLPTCSYKMKYKTICKDIGLPDIDKCSNPTANIKLKLCNTIKALADALKDNDTISIKDHPSKDTDTKKFINNSYITITLSKPYKDKVLYYANGYEELPAPDENPKI